jgi:2-amino-4-hydroxy-6-hydroxymethyldihydropteridine diphosphokinase
VARAFIGLGSNIGDREAHLRAAVEALRRAGLAVPRVSRFIRTAPVGKTDQPEFLNGVAEVETELPPRTLLGLLLRIEGELGRVRSERWGPRIIDMDLLLYEGEVLREPGLEVPHPRMHERLFVLAPLAEIAPEVRHPALGKSAAELLREALSAARKGR